MSRQHTSPVLRILFRMAVNVGLVLFLQRSLPTFFLLTGGMRAVVFVGLVLTLLNTTLVPVLRLITFPVKFIAWVLGFFLTNLAALWLLWWFVTALAFEGVTLTIGGGLVGWFTVSLYLGFVNWLVRKVT